ncbi:MAG: DUF6132 family protein [Elusimicrobiota bacterium]
MTKIALAVFLGAALGFGWHRLVGCATGACPLTANPYISTLFGAVLGLLVATA